MDLELGGSVVLVSGAGPDLGPAIGLTFASGRTSRSTTAAMRCRSRRPA